jgi:protein-L-isoaspartate O-methyltransferase
VTDWAEVIRRVPRERYVPDLIWRHTRGDGGNDLAPIDRRTDPDTWAEIVAAEGPVITQVDNGQPSADGTGREVTSSASDRRVVLRMLELLDAQPGDRVLEIGTGTGWNAALLAAGGASVITVEVDRQLSERARALFDQTGDHVHVVTGDGLQGWPPEGPYDRLIATVGVQSVPAAWVAQTRVGGRLVAPLTKLWQPPGAVVLERTAAGAEGHIGADAAFMSVRAQHRPRVRAADYQAPTEAESRSELHPYNLVGDLDTSLAIGQRVSGVSWIWADSSSVGVLWLYGDDGQSWAWLDTDGDVEQAGPRRLFDEVADAYAWWVARGKPTRGDWRVSVDLDGRQSLTL